MTYSSVQPSRLAQLVERETVNLKVVGSNPPVRVHLSFPHDTLCLEPYTAPHSTQLVHLVVLITQQECTHRAPLVHWQDRDSYLKQLCSTWFRSRDLWVMSPTRFLCATEHFHVSARTISSLSSLLLCWSQQLIYAWTYSHVCTYSKGWLTSLQYRHTLKQSMYG